MCAWLVVLRKGSRWLVQRFLFVHGINDAVRWACSDAFLAFKKAFDLFLMLLEGHAIMRWVLTMLFGLCVGLLILVETELPSFDILQSNRERVAKVEDTNVGEARQQEIVGRQGKATPERQQVTLTEGQEPITFSVKITLSSAAEQWLTTFLEGMDPRTTQAPTSTSAHV
jgi:hypothetical protein